MSSRSLLLQLPRDILHTVYSEWLSSWQDLSCLDVGCVGEGDRESWLSSLSELKMSEGFNYSRLSGECMRRWYEWVISRKVHLVEMFPVRLSMFAKLGLQLDFGSYCLSIHSIEIQNNLDMKTHPLERNVLEVLKHRIYLLIKECIHLERVKYIEYGKYGMVNNLVFSALRKVLYPNTIRSIYIDIKSVSSPSTESKMCQFFSNQILSLEDLEISGRFGLIISNLSKECVDAIMSILHGKASALKRLCLRIAHIFWRKLLVCLSTIGAHLETLEIGDDFLPIKVDHVEEDDLSTLGRSCPRLKKLKFSISHNTISEAFSVRKLCQLYELCPNFISIYFSARSETISIDVNDPNGSLFILNLNDDMSREEEALFLECVCLAIQRSQCKRSISNRLFCHNLIKQHDDWVLFKSKLSPYLTDLKGVMSEPILLEALKDLPRLEKLKVDLEEEKFSDLSLVAIIEYGYGLKTLSIFNGGSISNLCSFSDEMMSKMIRGCEMLEVLEIPGAGYESVMAVKNHSRLKEVYLHEVRVEKEEMSGMLLVDEREGEEKCVWRRLQKGEISGEEYIFNYIETEGCWECS